MRDILEAKIAALEENGRVLKGLSEIKRRVADDTENPPEDPQTFQQKAREDEQNGTAARRQCRISSKLGRRNRPHPTREIDAQNYQATPRLSDGTIGAPLDLRPFFAQFHDEAR